MKQFSNYDYLHLIEEGDKDFILVKNALLNVETYNTLPNNLCRQAADNYLKALMAFYELPLDFIPLREYLEMNKEGFNFLSADIAWLNESAVDNHSPSNIEKAIEIVDGIRKCVVTITGQV